MADSTPLTLGHWVTRLITAGIFAMGAFPKFTGGATELAEKLPGGNAAAIGIGVAEVVAIVLMFVSRTTLMGTGLAAILMLGAIGSHVVGPVGLEGDMATMFALAIAAFITATAATIIAIKRTPKSRITSADQSS